MAKRKQPLVQGYRSLVETPWGDAAKLKRRKLRPGRGTPREEAKRNQRERLFAALVATVAERGYEATTVANLVELSGVSRSAFYRHFRDKQACFIAAIEAMVGPALETVEGRFHPIEQTESHGLAADYVRVRLSLGTIGFSHGRDYHGIAGGEGADATVEFRDARTRRSTYFERPRPARDQ